jgi:rhamnose transport system permease protein
MSDTVTAPLATPPATPQRPQGAAMWRSALRWEAGLVLVLIATMFFGAHESSKFLTSTTFFYVGLDMGEVAIMTLPLMLIVMTGEIDLSVASMLGLSGAVMGFLFEHHWPIALAMAVAICVGALGGALNGLLVTRLGLPSIAVTIGSLTLFRGLAEIILGTSTVTGYPTSLTKIGVLPVPHTRLAYSIAIFLVLAAITAVVLHATPLGRSIVAIGLQSEAAAFAGIRVNRIKFALYVASGVLCALAGILFSLKDASTRYDAGTGLELTVVAIVLLGGVSIFGGRGSVVGVVLAVVIVGSLDQALTLKNVNPQVQNIVTGGLLLVSVIAPNSAAALRRVRARPRRGIDAAAGTTAGPLKGRESA